MDKNLNKIIIDELFSRLKIKNLRQNKNKGFTLIEVLVSVFIFAMMIVVISQVYIAVLRTERVAYALLNSENNIRNNLEAIARSVRVGKNFTVSENNTIISFDYLSEGSWSTMEYRFNENENNLEKIVDQKPFSLFDPQIDVNYSRFYLQDSGFPSQRTIIIILEASTKVNNQEYTFNVQTSITPRSLMEQEIVSSCATLQIIFDDAYGFGCGDTDYNLVADFNNDKIIQFEDLMIFSTNSGNEAWCQEQLEKTYDPCI